MSVFHPQQLARAQVLYTKAQVQEWQQAQARDIIRRPKSRPVLKRLNIGGYEYYSCTERGIFPVFSTILRTRVKKKKASNVVIVGEPGDGKTYQGFDLARVLAGAGIHPRNFSIDQVVFTYKQFMKMLSILRMGKPICFDEPSYAMSNREWYKDINQALVRTIESFRFKVHPLFIPIVNMNLLDKTIRTYLIQYMIQMVDRGRAKVYRIMQKHHESGYYHPLLCELHYKMLDPEKCERDSCLDCKALDHPKDKPCMIFRAQYERKKRDQQDERYQASLEQFTAKEAKLMTDDKIEVLLIDEKTIPKIQKDDGSPDPTAIRIILEDDWNLKIGRNRSYKIAKGLAMRYPKKFSYRDEA